MLAGMLLRRFGTLPADAHKGVNAWLIYLAMPAISFKHLPYVVWSPELLVPILVPLLVFVAGLAYVKLYAKVNSIAPATTGGLMLMAGLGNTGFVGLPLVSAYFGELNMGTAVICDQVTVLLVSTLGAAIAIKASGAKTVELSDILKKVLRFPPLIGCLLALTVPRWVDIAPAAPLFQAVAATTAPLALFSIGLQLRLEGWTQQAGVVGSVLAYKLVLAPAIVLAALMFFQVKGATAEISLFQMGMPSLLSAAVVASEYNLNPPLMNRIAGMGIVAGLGTSYLWFLATKLLA